MKNKIKIRDCIKYGKNKIRINLFVNLYWIKNIKIKNKINKGIVLTYQVQLHHQNFFFSIIIRYLVKLKVQILFR